MYVEDRSLTVRSTRRGKKGQEIAFTEVTDRDGAEEIRNKDVFVAERRSLGPGEYWPDQLVGLEVVPAGGTVVDVEHGPSQARLVIERGSTRFQVPFVDELVPVVDLEAGRVEVNEIDGLTEL